MSFYHPSISLTAPGPVQTRGVDDKDMGNTKEEKGLVDDNEEDKEWTIRPYHLNLVNKTSETVLLFDFPSNLQACLNDVSIQMSCFDYLNPLILTPLIRSKIEIFVSSTGRSVAELDCFCLQYPSLNVEALLDKPIFYPPNYAINYLKPSLTRAIQIKTQFVHLIDKKSRQPPLNPEYRPLSEIFLEGIVNRLPNLISPSPSSSPSPASGVRR